MEENKVKLLIEHLNNKESLLANSDYNKLMNEISSNTRKLTFEINTKYHSDEEVRQIIEQITNQKIDKNFSLFPPIYIDFGRNLKIGKNVFINAGCCFQDQGGIEIGDYVNIGHQCIFATLNHGLKKEEKHNLYPKKIIIKPYAWIGSHSIILPGVTIGENSIVGAGSVVTKDVPDNAIAVGNPAKIIKFINY